MNLKMKNTTYDVLNSTVRYVMPAAGTLYFTLSQIWGLPAATEVLGSISATSAFLAVLIALARNGWVGDDSLVLDLRDPEDMRFGFESGRLIEDLSDGEQLTLDIKVVDGPRRAEI